MENGSRVPNVMHHVYFWDGFKYPSVTTIIHRIEPPSHGLMEWKRNYRPNKDFRSAKEYTFYTSMRGTFVHYAVLSTLLPFPLDPSDLPKLSNWQRWDEKLVADVRAAKALWDDIELHVEHPVVESPMCHHGKWYAGTPDLRGIIKYKGEKKYTLADIKTSKRPYESHYIQIGAYAQMVNDSKEKHKIERGLLIYLNPGASSADIVPIEKDEITEQIEIFNSMRDDFYAIEGVVNEYGLHLPQ